MIRIILDLETDGNPEDLLKAFLADRGAELKTFAHAFSNVYAEEFKNEVKPMPIGASIHKCSADDGHCDICNYLKSYKADYLARSDITSFLDWTD